MLPVCSCLDDMFGSELQKENQEVTSEVVCPVLLQSAAAQRGGSPFLFLLFLFMTEQREDKGGPLIFWLSVTYVF